MDSLSKKYYKISEVSEIVGVPQSTLRFWEKEFPSVSPKRNAKGSRFYSPADIERLRMIHYMLHEKGMRIEAAKAQLRINSTGVSRKFEAIRRLQSIRDRLSLLLEAMDTRRKNHPSF